MRTKLATIAVAAVSLFGISALESPATALVDMSGKRVELVVPYSEGGGTDIYARFLAPILSERLPGEPTIIVRNIPGAGAIAGSNQFQQRAEPDGTSLIAVSASATLNYAFRDPRVEYKLGEWIPILSTAVGTVVYVHSKVGVESADEIEELQDKELVMGANNPTGGDLRALLSLDLLGIDVRPVFGMNRGDVHPAFERGEFNINFDTVTTYEENVMPMVEQGIAVPLFTLGYVDEQGNYGRDPSQPDLPSFLEVYEQVHGKPLEGEARKAWEAIFNLNVMASRALLLPAETPEEIVDTYVAAARQLLQDMEQDPELKKKAFEIMGPGPHTVGDAAARNLRGAVNFDDAAFEWLKGWLKENLDVTL